jgi:hypothetical protein
VKGFTLPPHRERVARVGGGNGDLDNFLSLAIRIRVWKPWRDIANIILHFVLVDDFYGRVDRGGVKGVHCESSTMATIFLAQNTTLLCSFINSLGSTFFVERPKVGNRSASGEPKWRF